MRTRPLNDATYVQKQGMVCPFCGGHNLDVSSPVIQAGDTAVQGVCCNECGRQWDDIYVLSGYQKQSSEPDPTEKAPLHPDDISDDVDVFPSAVTS